MAADREKHNMERDRDKQMSVDKEKHVEKDAERDERMATSTPNARESVKHDQEVKMKTEGLLVSSIARIPSRSQSPALLDSSAEQSTTIGLSYQEPAASSTSSKHSSERSHHSRSLSSTLPGQTIQTTTKSIEDSPQKQATSKLTSLSEYRDMSPGFQPANISYGGVSSDEYGSPLPRFSGGQQGDEGDGTGNSSSSRAATAIAHLNNKVGRTRDLIRLEQTIRDDNVNEYLKLAGNADKQQLQRIKAVFEKKNQKSAHSIAQLQKKLDNYHKRINNWETHGSNWGQGSHRQPREMLRDMGQGLKNVGGNIRDGITGLGGSVMSKPREFAHLIKNKFGSADNINQMAGRNNWDSRRLEGDGTGAHTLPGALRPGAEAAAAAAAAAGTQPGTGMAVSAGKGPSSEGSECESSVTSESIPGYHNQNVSNNLGEGVLAWKPIFTELQEDMDRFRDKMETFKSLSQDVSFLSLALQEERFRSERLEEQINDLTELHQNEVENLKQALADVEEKVQYQSEERVRDIQEMLELCQTKISKMEHQAAQQQQYVNLEGIEGLNARSLAVKLINIVLTVLQVVLLLVATAAGILMPFLRTRDHLKPRYYNNSHHGPSQESLLLHTVRILTTSMVVIGAVFVLKQWPEVWEISSHLMERLKKTVIGTDIAHR